MLIRRVRKEQHCRKWDLLLKHYGPQRCYPHIGDAGQIKPAKDGSSVSCVSMLLPAAEGQPPAVVNVSCRVPVTTRRRYRSSSRDRCACAPFIAQYLHRSQGTKDDKGHKLLLTAAFVLFGSMTSLTRPASNRSCTSPDKMASTGDHIKT